MKKLIICVWLCWSVIIFEGLAPQPMSEVIEMRMRNGRNNNTINDNSNDNPATQVTLRSCKQECDMILQTVKGCIYRVDTLLKASNLDLPVLSENLDMLCRYVHSCPYEPLKLLLENGLVNQAMALGGFINREGRTKRVWRIFNRLYWEYKIIEDYYRVQCLEFELESIRKVRVCA